MYPQYPAVAVVVALLTAASVADAAPPAFPGAEGFAAEIDGGRGGRLIKVTTLAASGLGSLQAALDTPGPRTVVFEVSGVIVAQQLMIPHGDLTIAGQTAPGGGITLGGRLWAAYEHGVDDIIIRHVRVRPVVDTTISGEQFDSVRFSLSERVLLDHVSISYGIDESLDLYEAKDVTVQWSTIERADTIGHPKGDHAFGLINGPDGRRISVHHNFFAHNESRNPAIANGPAEIVNNVVFDVRYGFIHNNPAQGEFQIVGNTFVRGPASHLVPFYFDDEAPGGALYDLRDNAIDDPGVFVGHVDNPFTSTAHPSFGDLGASGNPYAASALDFGGQGAYLRPVAIEASADAYDSVVACSGAFPRDVVTRGSFADLAERGGTWGANRPSDLMEGLTPVAAPADLDGDGIPDAREVALGLDPTDPEDAGVPDADGLSPLDHHLDALAAALVPCGGGEGGGGAPPAGDGGSGGSDPSTTTTTGGGGSDPGSTTSVGEGEGGDDAKATGDQTADANVVGRDAGPGCSVGTPHRAEGLAGAVAGVLAMLGLAMRSRRRR